MEILQFEKNEAAAAVIAAHYKRQPLFYLHSFGCQQNVNDGERIAGVLLQLGFAACDSPSEADLVLYNTCAVREHAEQRVFGNIGALKPLKEKNPRMFIGICGCMTQQKVIVDKLKKSYPYVDLVFGTNEIDLLPEMIADRIRSKRRVYHPLEERPEIVEGMPLQRGNSYRAWLPIMYGCDNYCSYCIVPYVRGRERSRRSEDIMAEFTQLVDSGCKDITLLGQNVNSYGKGLGEGNDFADLLQMLDAVPGDYRIRFMTSHPKDASRKLIDTIAGGTHICHHLHLPVQSGSNEMLVQMNRRYTAEDYLSLIRYAKEKIPDIMISSDIIVGFPGETEEDFQKTLDLVREVEYMQLFTFIYSKRTGTRAAGMPDATPRSEKTGRISRLCDLQDEITQRLAGALVGQTQRALVEGPAREGDGIMARLDNNMTVELQSNAPEGTFVNVHIDDAKGAVLKGTLVS